MTSRAGARLTDERLRALLWMVLALAGVMVGISYQNQALDVTNLDHLILPYDSDHWRRLAQIRGWLDGGQITDVIVPGTNAPFGGIVRHWSRAVDIMIAGFVKLMPSSMTMEERLMAGGGWYFVAVCLGLVAFLERATRRPGAVLVLPFLLVLGYFNAGFDGYFAPNNVDHHNVLCMLWACVLMLMMRPPDRARAAMLGLVLGLMAWISIEALVVVAFVYAFLGGHMVLRPGREEIPALVATGAALVAAAAMAIERPASWMEYVVYDTMSVVHVVLLSLCAAGAWAAALALRYVSGARSRGAVAAVAGGSILAAMWAVFPKFFYGPRVDADPFILNEFLPSITESRHLLDVPYQTAVSYLWQPALALIVLALTYRAKLWERDGWRRAVLAAAMAGAFAMVLTGTRWVYYLEPPALIVLAGLLPTLAVKARFFLLSVWPRRIRPLALLWVLVFSMMLFTRATGQEQFDEVCTFYQRYAIQDGQVQATLGDKPLVLFSLPTTAGFVNFFTPYQVIAGNYDREAQGMKEIAAIRRATTAEEARPLLEKRHVGAILICPGSEREEGWLYALADAEKRPSWLEFAGAMQIPGEEDEGNLPLVFRMTRGK